MVAKPGDDIFGPAHERFVAIEIALAEILFMLIRRSNTGKDDLEGFKQHMDNCADQMLLAGAQAGNRAGMLERALEISSQIRSLKDEMTQNIVVS